MTLEESIALAEKLQKDFAQLESCKREIRNNEDEIRKPVVINVRRRSMFRYFWPWILFAGTQFCVILFFSLIFLVTQYAKLAPVVMGAAFGIAVLIIIIGIKVSKKKAKEDNDSYEIAKDSAEKRRTDLFEKNRELDSTINSIKIQLGGNPVYEKIPLDKRKSSAMARAKLLLQSGKATDFEDALDKI